MDIEIIRELAKIIADQKLSKIDVEDESIHIVLEAQNNTVVNTVSVPQAMPVAAQAPVVAASTPTPEQKSSTASQNGYEQKSKIVGTLYLAADSTSAPFVTVGSKVKKGDTICIIESMKILNDIAAEADGTIVEICAENEQVVEFNQKLFVIEQN